ncbi:MAG: putative signal-transduction protein with domain [Frankiales bacterium]|nr:putative signal-transduction protein with domain [Frankiales bacterium]
MRAVVGDQIVVHGVHLDDPVRQGEVLEVHGAEGAPPYLVRWAGDDHRTLVFPGTDAVIQGPSGVRTD